MFLVLAGTIASVASAQVPQERLSAFGGVISRPFERITAIHELRDSRVVVVDANAQAVYLADFEKNTANQIGRNGSGPGEYLFPMRLFNLGGDSVGIEDGGNLRILVLTGKGKFGGVLNSAGGHATRSRPAGETPRASDRHGRLYANGYSMMAPLEAQPADSAPIERWSLGAATRDTVAWFPLPPRSKREVLPGEGWRAFETSAQWAVAPDGSIAIVRPGPYYAEVIAPNGTRSRGPVNSYTMIRVSPAQKEAWIEEQSRPRPVLIESPGKPMPTAGLRATKPVEPIQWPRYLPPFLDHALQFAPDGTLWIARTTAGSMATFDLADSTGTVRKQVVVTTQRTRLAGFGADHVYVIYTHSDQQEFLARYRAPRLR
jgi:hypothetical protein